MKIRIEDVARPSCRMPIINNPTIFMSDLGLLAAVNYSDAKKDTNLYLVDVRAMQCRKYSVPDAQYGAYGFVRGSDGNLYLGFFGGKIYMFDMAARSFSMVAHPFPDRLVWGGGASQMGKIYMGVYSTGEFCEYDILTRKYDVFAPMPKDSLSHYASEFAELPGGRILVYIQGAKPTFVLYDPASKRIEKKYALDLHAKASRSLAALDSERVIFSSGDAVKVFNIVAGSFESDLLSKIPESFHYLNRCGEAFTAVSLSSGGMYRFDRNGYALLKDKLADNNVPSGGVHAVDSRTYACVGDNGLFTRFDSETGREEHLQLPNETSCGMNLQMLKKDPHSHFVVGSHFINSQVFCLNLETKVSVSSLSKVVAHPGQINCATFLDGLCYLGSYGHANILVYDPRRPFECNRNPRLVGASGHEQNRPVAIANDGRLVYMATKANYQTLGGAITVLDPAAGAIEVYRDFVESQNPTAMFYHASGVLAGATQTFGDMRTHAPKAKNAVIYVWDTRRRKTAHMAAPWEADTLPAQALSPSGTLIGFAADRYYLFSLADFSCKTVATGLKSVSGGLFLDDKLFLGCCRAAAGGGQAFFVLDIESNSAREICPADETRIFEMISPREILVNHGEYMVKKLVLE